MDSRIKAVVRYDGTGFAGWQIQPGQRTVQGAIEDALERIEGHTVRIAGAGRTDSGVHALGQVFSCECPTRKSPEELRRSLSQMLGPEIHIDSIEEVESDFHASYNAVGKRYAYTIARAKEPDPFLAPYAWTLPWTFDIPRLEELARRFEGEHDFAGFCSSGSSVETTVRTIHSVSLKPGPVVGPVSAENAWHIEFHGEGFLYKMIRNIMGTLVDVARGQLPESRIDDLLASPGPYEGFTAPGKGLFLVEVLY